MPSLSGFYKNRKLQDLPGTLNIPCLLAMLSDPGEISTTLPLSVISFCLLSEGRHRLSLLGLTRLYHFTLSHYGSQTFLPPLKPCVTALAPRLDTGCWLDFTRLGVSPSYILNAELAHPSKTRSVNILLEVGLI